LDVGKRIHDLIKILAISVDGSHYCKTNK